MNKFTGNQNTTASLPDVLDALKTNIMRTSHVGELVQVNSIDDTNRLFNCSLLTNPDLKISCIALQDLTFQQHDVALVIFTDTDFRVNLSKVKNNQPISKLNSSTFHSNNFGVLVGLVYRKIVEEKI